MLVYKDQTFCGFWNECKEGKGCYRALTEKIKEGAKNWGLPISEFADKPKCFKPKAEK